VEIEEGQQKIKLSAPTNNQIYGLPANQLSPSAGTTLVTEWQVAAAIVAPV